MKTQLLILKILSFSMIGALLVGCAEGPLWRTGYVSPWVRNKWNEEEKIAANYQVRRARLRTMVSNAQAGSDVEKKTAATKLIGLVQSDPILLMRIEAVKLMGELPLNYTRDGLIAASNDDHADVRKAAIMAWKNIGDAEAFKQLQEMVAGDTDLDVRIAATRALGGSASEQSIRTLAMALDDPDPAAQFRATKALADATGEKFGQDVAAWKQFVKTRSGPVGLPDKPMTFDVRQTSGTETEGEFRPDRN